jgi:hypothetical protein
MQPKLIHDTVMQVELQDKDAKQLFIPQLYSIKSGLRLGNMKIPRN